MLFLMYSDLHIRPEKIEVCEKVLSSIGTMARDLQEETGKQVVIVNGGDTFHTRGVIRTSCFDRLHWHYQSWADLGLKQIIIVGNHDQEDRAGEIHPMRVFDRFPGWHIVDRPMTIPDFPKMAFYPYMKMEHIKPAMEYAAKKFKGFDAFVHWGVRGAKRNDTNTDEDGVPLDWLSWAGNVFSGHYHYRNKIGNVQYIGSPFQQDFGEMGQEKGVLIYDSETKKTRFQEITGTPRHREIKISWPDGEEKIETDGKIEEKDHYRILSVGDAERCIQVTRDYVARKFPGISSVSFKKEVKEKSYSRLNIGSSELHTPASIIPKYVSFVSTSLDKKRLIDIGNAILEGKCSDQ